MVSLSDDSSGNCVAATSGIVAGMWQDQACNNEFNYVCEKGRIGFTAPPVTQPPPPTQPSNQGCAPGWIGYGNFCYRVRRYMCVWGGGCEGMGGDEGRLMGVTHNLYHQHNQVIRDVTLDGLDMGISAVGQEDMCVCVEGMGGDEGRLMGVSHSSHHQHNQVIRDVPQDGLDMGISAPGGFTPTDKAKHIIVLEN